MEKFLVLGNAPCLLDELKGENLSRFDKVIRVNAWQPIFEYDNRCDVWVCYCRHHFGYENRFDVVEHAKLAPELWNAWHWTRHEFEGIVGRKARLTLSKKGEHFWHNQMKAPVQPTAGMYAIFMALQYGLDADVYVAGFSFFEKIKEEGLHYYPTGGAATIDKWLNRVTFHDPGFKAERAFYTRGIKEGWLNYIKGKDAYFEQIKGNKER